MQKQPKNKEEANKLILAAHGATHMGTKKTQAALYKEGWSWIGMHSMVSAVVHNCSVCRSWTFQRAAYHRLQTTNQVVQLPWDVVQIDHIMSFRQSRYMVDGSGPDINEYTCIMVLYDVFTGFVICNPQVTKGAEEMCMALEKIFGIIGYPKTVQTDNDCLGCAPCAQSI